MNSNFLPSLIPDPQEPSDDDFNAVGGEIFATFSPWASWLSNGNPFAPTPTTGLPAAAGGSADGQSDPSSVVAVSSGGITINLLFDAAALAAPASFRAGIQQAVAILAASISDKITVNLKIDYSGTGGGAAAGPDHGLFESYSLVRADLINGATPGDTSFNALAAGSSIQGQSNVAVWNAQLKLWGLMAPNDTTTDDGSATFATDINPNLLVGVALHELTHAMGRVPYGAQPDIFDLFRFTGAGTRLFQGGATAPAAYFSLDGGNTKLADYGRTSDASDFLNSGVQGSSDPFNEFYNGATSQKLTATDLKQLDALGFHLVTPDTQTPTLVSDNPLSIQAGATQTITSSLLNATDNVSSGAQLHYTVTAGPTHGTVLLSGAATSSFTQADINNGLVSYHETVGGVPSDSFSFNVGDAAGNTTGAAAFQIQISNPNHAPTADFDADGKSDILWVNDDGTVGVWNGGQPGTAHLVANPGTVPSTSHVAGIGDFDGNGHADILWQDNNGAVSVWDNGQPGGAHTLVTAGMVPAGWHIAGVGDFDGNGKSDILWVDDDGTVGVWDGGQPGTAHLVANPGTVPSTSHVAGIGDFDGNGHDDILWQDNNGAVFVWDNGQPSGAHTLVTAGMVPAGWHIAGVGDFDGNSKSDILWVNNDGTVGVWDGGQPSTAHWVANPGTVPSTSHVAGIGDFDGNGHADILWQDNNGAVSAWDNGQSGGAHTLVAAGMIPAGWHIA